MCTAIAFPLSELPTALLKSPAITERIYDREGRPEVQFHWWQTPTLLPVRWQGRLQLIRWGSKARRGTSLPYGGWVPEDRIVTGIFASAKPERVVIPAVLAHDAGTWFVVIEGIHGVLVRDSDGPVVYMLTRPSTYYYRNMTEQTPMMPLFVNQVI